MNKTVIHTDNAPKAIGPYSQAIRMGDFLFCSGQISIDPKTQEVFTGDIKQQTEMVLGNIEALLKAADMNFSHIVKTTISLTVAKSDMLVRKIVVLIMCEKLRLLFFRIASMLLSTISV